jgi:hypothetical protein
MMAGRFFSMTNSTRLLGLIMTAALCVCTAVAQDVAPRTSASDSAMELPLPAYEADEPGIDSPRSREESVLGDSERIDIDSLEGVHDDPVIGHGPAQPHWHGLWAHHQAPIESTGTWLRRGFWYAEAEAVVWNRQWNRDDKIFAAADNSVNNPQFFDPRASLQILNTNRLLVLDGTEPGEDTSVRGTLGHFLFRDSQNRDHTAEFTIMGSGEWHQERRVSSQNPFGLQVPFFIDATNRSFDNSTTQHIDYSSTYRSFETNYRVMGRLGRDQLVMDPNGNWHRSANAGWQREYLVGLRYMNLRDIFDWTAEDIVAVGRDGSYLIRTDNDMFGFQMGTGLVHERARWSLGMHAKGGVFLNNAHGRTTLNFTLDDLNDADLLLQNDELSFIGEFKIVGRWHILPDLSLRAAYEMMYVTSQALAPNQATFITDFSYLNTTQDPFYHGAAFGIEGYW